MENHYNLLVELIKHVEEFQNSSVNDKNSIREFSVYLKGKIFDAEDKRKWDEEANYDQPDKVSYIEVPEVEFSTLVATLYRFAKNYIKKAFENSTFKTLDEFGFMASIFKHGSLLKSEVINLHMMEISSGSEILKRLLKYELIYEFPDEKDGRAKRVSLTQKGVHEIIGAFGEMHKVAKIVSGNLTGRELHETIFTLNKLKFFHEDILHNHKGEEINNILNKFVLNN